MSAPRPVAAPVQHAPEKKGEVNELRTLLRTVNTEKDSKRKRDVIKKVRALRRVAGAAAFDDAGAEAMPVQ